MKSLIFLLIPLSLQSSWGRTAQDFPELEEPPQQQWSEEQEWEMQQLQEQIEREEFRRQQLEEELLWQQQQRQEETQEIDEMRTPEEETQFNQLPFSDDTITGQPRFPGGD
jgi:hypothetical protein